MRHPRQHPVVSETSPPLGYPFTQNHTWAVRGQQPSLMPFWFPSAGIQLERFRVCAYTCVSVCVCVFASAGRSAAVKGWGGWGGGCWSDKSCGADVPTASRASWMATVVMVTGKRVGGLAYALQSSEWLEFNMAERTSSCVQAGDKAPSLLLSLQRSRSLSLFLLSPLNHLPSVNVAVIIHCVDGFHCEKKPQILSWYTFKIANMYVEEKDKSMETKEQRMGSPSVIDLMWKCYDWSID